MLAKTFKTAAELGIPEHECHALKTVLFMIEDGEIEPELIRMEQWHVNTECGTAHCLAGWANAIDKTAFPEIENPSMLLLSKMSERLPKELLNVFGFDQRQSFLYGTEKHAVASLRHYLETGHCLMK
jgi:hypothetical protein